MQKIHRTQKIQKYFGLLREKLGHSFSPLIRNLDSFMTERRFDGINVTIPLLLEAERLSISCVDGLAMLVVEVEGRVFLNAPLRLELVNEIFEAILKKIRNVVLIGMPGCGKSTVGRELAKAMERPFVDVDERIEAVTGKNIPEIFTNEGEEVFRRLETRILGEEAKKSGMVIATGGGVVTRPENRDLLRQNSLTVYLKRELNELVTDGRPLSKGIGVQALAEQRLPLYEAWSDRIVPVEARPELTTMRILEAIR